MLLQVSSDGPLQIVSAAVTPVVLVSATAILISGVSSRYIAISDRVRSLMKEFRDSTTGDERRAVIRSQLSIFERRVHLISWAIRILYVAAACFITVALLISATLWREILIMATLPLFLSGIVLIMVAIVFQLMELQASNRTIFLEMGNVNEHND